jgi:hypothetical protein
LGVPTKKIYFLPKMKLNLSFLTGAASLAALLSGAIADSAVTDPVGYITLNVPGTANPAAPKVSYQGASLVRETIYAGSPVSGVGNSATFAASSFTTVFGLNALNQPAYYVEIASGPDAGVWTDITATTGGNVLTLADAIGAKFTSTVTVKIRKHHTVASVFGDNTVSNPLTLQGGEDNTSADLVELVSSTATKQIIFNTEENAWFAGSTASNEQIIAPGDGIKLTRRGATKTITQVGHVKTGQTVLAIESGVNLVATPLAVPTIGTTAAPLPFNFNNSALRPGLTSGEDNTTADLILQLDSAGAATQIIYNSEEDGYFAGANPVGTTSIPEGTSLRIFHRGPAFNWTVPAVLIAP